MPDAAFAISLYGAVQTQWAVGPAGQPLGLRYEACLPVLEYKRQQWLRNGLDDVPEPDVLLEDVQVIERALIFVSEERRAGAGVAGHG